jgi:hypothetical protein
MNRKLGLAIALSLSCFVAADATAQGRMTFGDAESFKNSVPLQRNVLDVLIAPLKNDKYYRNVVVGKSDDDLNKLFDAVVVHLSGSNEIDYVIEGNLPLAGADNGWFWVVRAKAGEKPTIALQCSTGELELLQSRHLGFRDIRTIWIMGPSHVEKYFQFNGVNYVLARTVDKSE